MAELRLQVVHWVAELYGSHLLKIVIFLKNLNDCPFAVRLFFVADFTAKLTHQELEFSIGKVG